MVTSSLTKAKWEKLTDINTDLSIIITLQDDYKLDWGIEQPAFHYNKANWKGCQTDTEKISISQVKNNDIDIFTKKHLTSILKITAKYIPNSHMPSNINPNYKKQKYTQIWHKI